MYKAIQEIGGYKVGEEVPADKAEIWLKMYSVPPVEKVSGEGKKSEPEEKKESVPEEKPESSNVMLDDYLGRNENVVRKNIEEDNLSSKQLKGLLELEKSDKKRSKIIRAIKKKLKD